MAYKSNVAMVTASLLFGFLHCVARDRKLYVGFQAPWGCVLPFFFARICIVKSSQALCGQPFGPMTVEIKQDIRLSFDDGKFISLPESLIVTHNGDQFVKVKATSASIISVITGKVAPKNGSFATSKNLQELLRLRNEAAAKHGSSSQQVEGEDLYKDVVTQPPAKKLKIFVPSDPNDSYTVDIKVKDRQVVCLMTGQRPGKTDLTVKVDAEMLAVVFQFLREDIDVAMEGSKRSHAKKTT